MIKKHIGLVTVSVVFFLYYLVGHTNFSYFFPKTSSKINFKLKDETNKVGINHLHQTFDVVAELKHLAPWITAVGASVSVADVNGDGYPDIFLNSVKIGTTSMLYINQKNGTFLDKTAEFGIDFTNSLNTTGGAIFVDVNNDGYPDLFLVNICPQLWINNKGKNFTLSSQKFPCSGYSAAYTAFDYNHDGKVDLMWANYYAINVSQSLDVSRGVMPENFNDSSNHSRIFLFENVGDGTFKDVSYKIPQETMRGWYFSIADFDLERNGAHDLWIASDFGADHFLTQNLKDYSWSNRSKLIDHASHSKNGMGVDISYLYHDERPFIYTSNIFRGRERTSGNMLWSYKDGAFSESARAAGVYGCGWTWGSRFVDLDLDSWDDIVVPNGMFGSKERPSYWYKLTVLDGAGKSIMGNFKNWPSMLSYSLDADQRGCVFLHKPGETTFDEITEQTDFDLEHNFGRALALIDVNNNGKIGLIMANQGGWAKFYQTYPSNENQWIGFKLIGHASSRDAWSTRIVVTLTNGERLEKGLYPIRGFMAQSDSRLLFGLGKNQVAKVEVFWPSGKTMLLNQFHINQYQTIEEINDEIK